LFYFSKDNFFLNKIIKYNKNVVKDLREDIFREFYIKEGITKYESCK